MAKFKLLLIIASVFIINNFEVSNIGAQTVARPDRGGGANVPFDSSGVGNVNLQNGNLSFSIPLASLPPIAGGKLGFTLSAHYNSKLWDTYIEQRMKPPEHPYEGPAVPYDVAIPRLSDLGGWRLSGTYGFRYDYHFNDYERHPGYSDMDDQILASGAWQKISFVTPDGSAHEIRPFAQPFWGNNTFYLGYFKDTPHSTGQPMRYYTSDGSYIWMTLYPTGYTLEWEAQLPDGTKIEQTRNGPQRIIDPNGNKIKIFGDSEGIHYQDELTGREIRVFENTETGRSEIRYQKVGGDWEKVEIVWGTTQVRNQLYEVTIPDQPYGNGCVYHVPVNETLNVVQEIIFPKTELNHPNPKYTFDYTSDETLPNSIPYTPNCMSAPETIDNVSNGLGEINKIVTPSGAEMEYSYVTEGPGIATNFATSRIGEKLLTHDGTTDSWTYQIGEYGATVTGSDGSTRVTDQYYHGAGLASSNGGVAGLGGLTYRETVSGKVRTERKWGGKVFDGAYTVVGESLLTFNPVVLEEYTSLLDDSGNPVKISAKTFQYDFNGNVTSTSEYDWFDPATVNRDSLGLPTGVPSGATLLRTTTNVYHNSPSSYTSQDVYAKTNNQFLNALKETSVGNSITRYTYDSQLYGTAPIKGNVTKIEAWDNVGNQWIASQTGYDIYGNVISKTDANGNVTQILYEDNTHALPTKTIVDPDNGTGEQVSSATYDFYTGFPLTSTDVNGNISSINYINHLLEEIDPYGRPGTAYGPNVSIGGVNKRKTAKTYYEDFNRRTRSESDLFDESDALSKSRTTRDQMGRSILSETNENGSSDFTISAETVYKNQQRVSFSSNPRRNTGAATDAWTRVTSDTLGRTIESATFSGTSLPPNTGTNANWTGSVTTEFSANVTTVTDQAGKKGRNITNALGQLTRIDEPNGNNELGSITSPNQATYYSYNTLGKMVKVNQGVQNRYFMYDSLGRLLRVRQPEQEVNTDLNTSGNPDNNSWTAGFTYDNNGNVLSATDAKNVTITNTYDSLNRVTQRSYNDSPQTPTVTFTYDEFDHAKGKLTKVSSNVSESRYSEFDEVGRLKKFEQYTDGETYTSKYTYDLSGALVEEEYPSGRKVKNEFDQNGDLSRIFGKATATATERTYANSFTYSADGKIEKLKLGNGLWEAAKFNSRLQVTEFGLGHGPASGDLWKLTNEYGELQTNGTVDTTKNSGNIGRQTLSFNGLANPFVETYKYDPLYRLIEAKETNNGNQTWKQIFGYDRFGNRTTHEKYIGTTQQTLTAEVHPEIDDETNRFESTEGFTFDANGNVVIDAQGRQFTFNGDNKQTQVKDDQDNVIGEYLYDGEGKRIKKVTDDEMTVFVYSAGKLIAEYSTAIPPQNPTTRYTVTDQLGSPRVIVDALGQVVSRRDFLPFGEEIEPDGTYRTTNQKYGQADHVRQKFTGYQNDEETGLDFAEARMYENRHGRFTAVDPLLASGKSSNPQTFNRYVYVLNNPTVLTDPTGLQVGCDPKVRCEVTSEATIDVTGIRYKGFEPRLIYDTDGAWDPKMAGLSMNQNTEAIGDVGIGMKNGGINFALGLAHMLAKNPMNPIAPAADAIFGQLYQRPDNMTQAISMIGTEIALGFLTGRAAGGLVRFSSARFSAATVETLSPSQLNFTDSIRRSSLRRNADSIFQNGVQQPVDYTVINGQRYLLDGNNRTLLASRFGQTVPAQQQSLPFGAWRSEAEVLQNSSRYGNPFASPTVRQFFRNYTPPGQ